MPEGSPPTPQTPSTDAPPPKRLAPPRPPALRPRPAPAGTAQAEIQQALAAEQPLVIRTMQDDVKAARLAPASRRGAGGQARVQQPPAAPIATAPPVPLPPKPGGGASKVIMKPARSRRRPSRLTGVLLSALAVVLLAGAGVVWWLQGGFTLPGQEAAAPLAPLPEVLPARTAAVVRYDVPEGQARGELISAWNAAGRGDPSLATLVAGDPRLLLLEAAIDSFAYVLLEDETRPYLLVPQGERTQELLADTPEARAAEVNGWYVVSPTNTDAYLSALAAGSLASQATSVPSSASAAGEPVQLWLGPQALRAVRQDALGNGLPDGLLQELLLAARADAAQSAWSLSGRGAALQSSVTPSLGATLPAAANQRLLSFIPEEADFVRLGSNFAADLSAWGPYAQTIDMAILERPAVAALGDQFTESYAFYSIPLSAAARDLALIVSIPAALQSQVVLPQPVVEQALGSLLPLITGRKALGPIEFGNNTHADVPLRYANFSQPSQALDYAIVDTWLVITTSRESMFSVLETMRGLHPAVDASPAWQPVLSAWGAVPAAANLVIGTLNLPQLTQFLPIVADGPAAFGLAVGADTSVSGIITLP